MLPCPGPLIIAMLSTLGSPSVPHIEDFGVLEAEGILDPGGSHIVNGIAISPSGDIFTVDSRTRTITRFSEDGKRQGEYGRSPEGSYFLRIPWEIQVDGSDIVISDRDPDAPALVWLKIADGSLVRRLPL